MSGGGRGRGSGGGAAPKAAAKKGAKGRGRKGKGAPCALGATSSSDSDGGDSMQMMDWENAEHRTAGAAPEALGPVGFRNVAPRWPYGAGRWLRNQASQSIDAHCFECGLATNRTVNRCVGTRNEFTRAQG